MTVDPHYGQLMAEHMTTAVVTLDASDHVLAMNPAAEALFRLSRRLAHGRRLPAWLSDGGQLLAACLRRTAVDGGRSAAQRALTLRLAADRRVTVDCTVTPLDEVAVGVMLLEFTPVDRKLRISREDRLLSQQAAVRSMLRGLGHEIKNPLGGLRGAAQLLERALPDAQWREFTRIIIGEADRLQALVDRMMTPHGAPQFQPVNLHEIVERVRLLQLSDGAARVAIRTDYDPSIPELEGDPAMLIQALLNLVRNAAQALTGAPRPQITIRTRVQGAVTIGARHHRQMVCVEIIDNGPGIPAELQRTVFYPMVTGRSDGVGLGLPIAQSLAHHHGGLIEFDSAPGRTVFSVYLPLSQQRAKGA